MRLSLSGLGFAVLLAVATPALSQDINAPLQLTDGEAREAIVAAFPLISKLSCGNAPCAAPTPDEFTKPPIDIDDARVALRVGTKSAQLSWCGLEWQSRTYEAMIQMFRQKYGNNPRPLALLHTIHSLRYGRDYTNLQVLKTCSAQTRADLDAQNPTMVSSGSLDNLTQSDVITKMLAVVLDKMPEAMCGPKQHCAPATAEEKANPPVTMDQARAAVQAGILSGTAEHCGLDWKRRVFVPMLAYHRQAQKMTNRQLAIMGVLHGIVQGYTATHYRVQKKACSADTRRNLDEKLPRLKGQKPNGETRGKQPPANHPPR